MSYDSPDIFDLTFEALQRSLSANSSKTQERAIASIEQSIENYTFGHAKQQCMNKIDNLSSRRNILIDRYYNSIKEKSNEISHVEGSHKLNLAVCKQYEHIVQRRLASQINGSDRRMKDLVFEVIGEYGKSNVRLNRRQEYLRKTGRAKVLACIWTHNWQKFSLRLKFDLCQAMLQGRASSDLASFQAAQNIIQCTHLNIMKDKEEIELVVRKLTKKIGLVSDKKVVIQSIIKVSKTSRDKSILQSSFRSANTVKDLQEIMVLLKTWAKRSSGLLPAPPVVAEGRNTASRGRSAPGTSRSRLLPVSAGPVMGPLLKELISTNSISWMHPASYLSSQWDELYQLLYQHEASCGTHTEQTFAAFVRKYHAQHTCAMWSDRAYFCLEERSLATRPDLTSEERATSPDSALLAALGTVADGNKEEKRAALENAITMQLLVTLQEQYVDHPYVHVTHTHESLRCETATESLRILREQLLTQPLTVVGFSSKHRMGVVKGNSSKTTQIIHKYLPSLPDILVVRAYNGALLHFAPAMLAHLPETRVFSAGNFTTEQKLQSSVRCPHPHIHSLSLSGAHYLDTLYCPILMQAVDAQNVLRDTKNTKTSSGMLSTPSVQAENESGAKKFTATKQFSGAAPSVVGEKSKSNPISTDVLPSSPLLLMPVSRDCMHALLTRYLVATGGVTAGTSTTEIETLAHPLREATAPVEHCNALSVLPDHARCRVSTSINMAATAGGGGTDSCSDTHTLRCSYVLLPDDKAAEVAAAASEAGGTPRKSSLNGSEAPRPTPAYIAPCYYLIQVYEQSEDFSTTAAESTVGTAAGVVGSELDETSETPSLSTTFALTQPATASSKGGKSSFDRKKQYDAEDDILRAVIFEEYKAALSCDMVISPSARSKEGKDSSKPSLGGAHIAVEALGRKPNTTGTTTTGAVSKLSALSPFTASSQQQMVEDDHDEGDTDPGDTTATPSNSNSNSSSHHNSSSTKRRWDANILSTVCRWRSCVCDSTIQRIGKSNVYKQKQLCAYHMEIRDFLDARGKTKQGQLESSKYLPRKAPNFNNSTIIAEKKRDMMTIRAASTLLQELWDGKLRATVRSFTKKVIRDITLRNYLENANTNLIISYPSYILYLTGQMEMHNRNQVNLFTIKNYISSRPPVLNAVNSVVPTQPTWAIWKNATYFDRTIEGQKLSLHILDTILLTEKELYQELLQLSDLHVYPSAELILIRKEMKLFKEQQDNILLNNTPEKKEIISSGSGESGADINNGYNDLIKILSIENKLCEHKLLLLNTRKQEEEEKRIIYMKKLARARAVEDNQARDPANFRNQRF